MHNNNNNNNDNNNDDDDKIQLLPCLKEVQLLAVQNPGQIIRQL